MKRAVLDPDIGPAGNLTHVELADHLPAVLEEICLALERSDLDIVQQAISSDAREHGQWRWRQGYQLDELVRELDLFRQVLADAVEAYPSIDARFGPGHLARTRYVVDEAISFVTLGSIREVLRERDHLIVEYTARLEEANQTLRKSKQQIDNLHKVRLGVTRRVAHDLRNFLGVFSSALQLASSAPEKVEAALRLANRQVLDMQSLTDELVDYAVVLSGRDAEDVERFSLRELYEELVQACQPLIERKGLAFYSVFDESLSVCVSKRLSVKQVAWNLLSNASKYTTSGSVGLSFNRTCDNRFRVSVIDSGIGISAIDSQRVFKEFQRAADDEIPGTGLGLAIVQELVLSLGGEVAMRSTPGVGSIFEVLLPLECAPAT
jgi:signal transduction histidine kinase